MTGTCKLPFHSQSQLWIEACTVHYRVVLTFKSVDEILLPDHSNVTSLAFLLCGTICVAVNLTNSNKIWDFPFSLSFGTLGRERV